MELLNHKGVFKHYLKFWEAFTLSVFASEFCSWLCIVILAWKYHSLNSQNIVEHLTRVFIYIARLCPRHGSLKKLTKRKKFQELNERREAGRLQLPKRPTLQKDWTQVAKIPSRLKMKSKHCGRHQMHASPSWRNCKDFTLHLGERYCDCIKKSKNKITEIV